MIPRLRRCHGRALSWLTTEPNVGVKIDCFLAFKNVLYTLMFLIYKADENLGQSILSGVAQNYNATLNNRFSIVFGVNVGVGSG